MTPLRVGFHTGGGQHRLLLLSQSSRLGGRARSSRDRVRLRGRSHLESRSRLVPPPRLPGGPAAGGPRAFGTSRYPLPDRRGLPHIRAPRSDSGSSLRHQCDPLGRPGRLSDGGYHRRKQTGIRMSHFAIGGGINAESVRSCLKTLKNHGYAGAVSLECDAGGRLLEESIRWVRETLNCLDYPHDIEETSDE